MNIINTIKKTNWLNTINLAIRGATLVGKFLLVYFFAEELTKTQYGVWGIFATSVSLALYVVGLNFYTYSTRRILDYKIEDRSPMLRDQILFYFISYLILFPLLGLLFVFNVIELKFAIFFYIILTVEHLSQEAYRTFVIFSKPITANIILFLRTGMWAYLLLISWWLGFDELKNLKAVYLFWIAGGISALIVSLYFLAQFKFKAVRHIPVDWNWIRQGIKVSSFFFIGTVGYKIIEFADRYFILYYHTADDVGVYTFYANMCNIVETFIHTAVIIIFSPKLIETFHKNNYDYRKTLAQFAKQVVVYTVLVGVALSLLIIPLLRRLEDPQYLADYNVFVVLVLAKMILNFSLIFHYILYIRKNDFPIIKATVFAAVINILLNFILIPSMSIMGAALATLISFFIIMLMKIYYSRNLPEAEANYLSPVPEEKKRRGNHPNV